MLYREGIKTKSLTLPYYEDEIVDLKGQLCG